MLNKIKTATLTSVMLAMGMSSAVVLAKGKPGADTAENMSRIVGASGSGHTVIDQCGGGTENWDEATATIEFSQNGGTVVEVALDDAKPETLYTVWVRLRGRDQQGISFGGSPITNGGATPLAPSTALDQLVADWVGSGSATQPNGFVTNARGNGKIELILDFPVTGGAYPFNRMSAETLALAQSKRAEATATPTAIADPRDAGITGTPFLVRLVSHCQDGLGHGLSPAAREAWFQYP